MASPLVLSLKKQRNFYGSQIKLLSPAKINLYLNVIGRYPGGFHRIDSIVERISLCDKITIEVTKTPGINIVSNNHKLATRQNLVFKAAQLIQKEFKFPGGFKIILQKNIPVGSGLGGGSSNAASALIGLQCLLGLKIDANRLFGMGARLGSDVNFFLAGCRFARLTGRGQKVEPLDIQKSYRHFIIWPGVSLATKKVYAGIDPKLTKIFNSVKILQYALSQGDVSLIEQSLFNALERKAFSVCSRLRKVKVYLESKGIFAIMTGSGSAFYSFSGNKPLSRIRNILPKGWRVFEARTF